MDRKIIEIQKKFNIPGRLINIKENYQGNINSTYILTYEENGKIKRYILQKINTDALDNDGTFLSTIIVDAYFGTVVGGE